MSQHPYKNTLERDRRADRQLSRSSFVSNSDTAKIRQIRRRLRIWSGSNYHTYGNLGKEILRGSNPSTLTDLPSSPVNPKALSDLVSPRSMANPHAVADLV